MEKILFKKEEVSDGYKYDYTVLAGGEIVILGDFLSDIGHDILPAMREIRDRKFCCYWFKRTVIDYWGEGVSLFDRDSYSYERDFCFTIDVKSLLKFLENWADVYWRRPDYITVTYIDRQLTLVGSNHIHPMCSVFSASYWPKNIIMDTHVSFVFVLGEHSCYKKDIFLVGAMDTLADFLRNDVAWLGVDFFRAWILNSEEMHLRGMWSLLMRRFDIIIIKNFIHLKEPNKYVAISEASFLAMLDDWEIIETCKPSMIVVHYDQGNVSFDSSDILAPS